MACTMPGFGVWVSGGVGRMARSVVRSEVRMARSEVRMARSVVRTEARMGPECGHNVGPKGVHFSKKWSHRAVVVTLRQKWREKVTQKSALFHELVKNSHVGNFSHFPTYRLRGCLKPPLARRFLTQKMGINDHILTPKWTTFRAVF